LLIGTRLTRAFYNQLQIPGEDTLAGVFSARRFVGWVNGDPEIVGDTTFTKEVHKSLTSYSDRNTCVIFGLGNVAVDCARILLRSVEELSATDIARSALETLKQSNVRKVLLIGRRGMAQAAFSPKELRELLQLPDVKVTVFDDALQAEDEEDLVTSRPRRRAVEAIRKAVDVGTDGDNKNLKELQIKFLRSPVALHGSPGGDDGRSVRTAVRSVTLEVNQLVGKSGNRKATGTGATETVDKIAVALRSVGYKSTSGCVNESESDAVSNINGYTRTLVPFDAEKGIVPNSLGRVQQVVSAGMGGGAWFVPGVYVCGWLKRGPKGIIGDNLVCATETVVSLVQDDEKGKLRRPDYRFRNKGILPSLLSKGVEVVDVEGWHKIDLLERQRGAAVGKPREKIVAKREMLQVARGE
jgi:adrenodoxin-NADP+ reductase|tara:strand:+ start:592 stop:1827 length:1236 start_codon:yes stop_codon:yes gene_type:complete